ncbi:MAG: hypoxanthine phosphoribosyltransferase [Actinobacteria bacterium]|nr:hypoxanthine phosphoribosyltransferase [Actinomycetota bacterium]MBM3712240.1 hypoxanthine phosphoribosyltransferase [Actinomycetota bacterium]
MENSDNFNLKNLTKSTILGRVLFPSQVIKNKVIQLGKAITEDYKYRDNDLLLISVLRGGVFFFTDLLRNIDLEISIDFIGISTYQTLGFKSSGVVKITKDLEESIEGKDIIIVEDIIDTGLTIDYLLRNLKSRYPTSIEICTLLDRNVRRIADIKIKYTGFTIGEEFVVGYGLDYKQKYRNLESIYELKIDTVKKDIETIQSSSSNNQ